MEKVTRVNPGASSLHEAFGISEERSEVIVDKVAEILHNGLSKGIESDELIEQLSAVCETTSELATVSFMSGVHCEKRSGNPFEKLLSVIASQADESDDDEIDEDVKGVPTKVGEA